MSQVKPHIIQSCYELTLEVFIACVVDGNLKLLGRGTPEQLQAAWGAIYEEYADMRGGSQTTEIMELEREIFVLDQKVKVTTICVELLWNFYNRDIANELKKIGFQLKLDWSNREAYHNELRTAISKSKTWATLALNKRKRITELVTSITANGYTRKDFTSMNNTLSKFMGYRIDPKVITVAEWCDLLLMYEHNLQEQYKEYNKKRA